MLILKTDRYVFDCVGNFSGKVRLCNIIEGEIGIEGEIWIVVASVEMMSLESVFVDGAIVSNKYWVGLVKLSEENKLIGCCCFIYW